MYQPPFSTSPHHTNHHPNENHIPNTPPKHLSIKPSIKCTKSNSTTTNKDFWKWPSRPHHTKHTLLHHQKHKPQATPKPPSHSPQCHRLPAAGRETKQVSHHIPHVHERRAIGSFFNEYERRKATGQNHEKKYYHQKIVNHTNNNLIVNLTNKILEPPLKSMVTKGLKLMVTNFLAPIIFIIKNMSLNHQTMGVLLSYGQQLTMKKKHST